MLYRIAGFGIGPYLNRYMVTISPKILQLIVEAQGLQLVVLYMPLLMESIPSSSWSPSIEEIRDTIAATDFGCKYLALGVFDAVEVQIAADDMQEKLSREKQEQEQEQQQLQEKQEQEQEKLMIGIIDVPSSVSLVDYIKMEAST